MESDERKRRVQETDQESFVSKMISDDVFQYYRGLIGQIEIALPKSSSRVVLFASSVEGEGTTEVVVGLGLTIAAGMGRRTAILDCNITNPDLHKRFGTGRSGFNEVLAGRLAMEDALQNTTVPNLYVLPIGEQFSTFGVYSKEDLAKAMAGLRQRFDYVLIDSAPFGVTPEATALCDKVDAVVMVVKHGKIRREVVRRTKETIERAGGKVLGVVFNKRKFPIPEFLYRRL
jgi:capsular exopolysaccharide synthesis family protein